jgi:LDH2 family malate/lactate/ureidoglycolate dehydrogenase
MSRLTPTATPPDTSVRVPYHDLIAFVAAVFAARGLPAGRARAAAEALCHGDLTGVTSHGLVNLTRLYLPLFDEGRVTPDAEPVIIADSGATVLLDARRALGLWAAGAAMDIAVARAAAHGVGFVWVRGGTHLGCAGHHAVRAVRHGMVGLVLSNCGRQRIARPPGGLRAMLGTNPLSVAAPAGPHPPFVLDMSTTVVPTGRVRAAARASRQIPTRWLADRDGAAVTDPAAFDRGDAHLLWLGGEPDTGAYKGYGLALVVEVLGALLAGAGLGPAHEALDGDGGPSGRDDDIGYLVAAIAPPRPAGDVAYDAAALFGALLACPPARPDEPVRYPGWLEHEHARVNLRQGVPLDPARYDELRNLAAETGLELPAAEGAR